MVDVNRAHENVMTKKEAERPWDVSEEAKKRWFESLERMKDRRKAEVEEWKKLEDIVNATYIGVMPPPPWHPGPVNPAVYKSNKDGTFFRIAGEKSKVATDKDPEEVRRRAEIIYSIPLESVGNYFIVPIDLRQHIDEGNAFFLGENDYINNKRYNPETDPPVF